MDKPRTLTKRPCSVCRRWFRPDPRVAHSQKTCSPDCSKVLTQRRQAKWRADNPDYDADRRLRARIEQAQRSGTLPQVRPDTHPLARLPLPVVQTAFGVERAVILTFALRLAVSAAQTPFETRNVSGRGFQPPLPPDFPQTAMEAGP